jgi:hypothetical protein
MKIIAIAIILGLAGCASSQPPQAPLTAEEVRASETRDFGVAMSAAKDGETQRLLVFAWALRNKGESAPQQVQQAPSVAGIVLGVVDRLIGITPAWFAYKSSIRNSQTTETVAAINRDVSIAQSNNFMNLGVAGFNSNATIAGLIQAPAANITTTFTNSGTGVAGSGTYNPITTNPNAKVCAVSTAGVLTCP